MDTHKIDVKKSILGYDVSELAITEIILRDFDNSWEYYKFNLEERRDIISRIYTFIGIPLATSSILFYLVDNNLFNYEFSNTLNHYAILFSISLIMLVYGELQIIALSIESGVSRDYLRFLNNVRQYVGIHSPELQPFLKFNAYEAALRQFLKEKTLDKTIDFKNFTGSTASPNQETTPHLVSTLDRAESYIRSKKGTYWRASSAIFIVSLCFMLLVISWFLWNNNDIDAVSLVLIGFAASFISFILNSMLFRRLAFGKNG